MSRKCNRMEILVAKRNRGEGYYNNNPTFAYGQGWDLACGGAGHRAVEKETHQLKLWEKEKQCFSELVGREAGHVKAEDDRIGSH